MYFLFHPLYTDAGDGLQSVDFIVFREDLEPGFHMIGAENHVKFAAVAYGFGFSYGYAYAAHIGRLLLVCTILQASYLICS